MKSLMSIVLFLLLVGLLCCYFESGNGVMYKITTDGGTVYMVPNYSYTYSGIAFEKDGKCYLMSNCSIEEIKKGNK